MIPVLLLAESVGFREQARAALARERWVALVAEAGSMAEAVHLLEKCRPQVVLLHEGVGPPAVVANRLVRASPVPVVLVGDSASAGRLPRAADLRLLEVGVVETARLSASPTAQEWKELLAAIRRAAATPVRLREAAAPPTPVPAPTPGPPARAGSLEGALVGIGVSTGGPPILAGVLGELPASFPAPIAVVQHMTDEFIDQFVEWLGSVIALEVKSPADGEKLLPGTVYVAGPAGHLAVDRDGVARIVPDPPQRGLRPAANVLFESMAKCRLERRIGLLLTGMGDDGARGLKQLRDSGGFTLVQDQESCAVYGMPKAALELGAADEVLKPKEMAARLRSLVDPAGWRAGLEAAGRLGR